MVRKPGHFAAWAAIGLVLTGWAGTGCDDRSRHSASPGPSIKVDPTEYKARPVNGHVRHTFVIRNVGSALLRIEKVISDCGCAVAELKKKELQPGESTGLEVDLQVSPERQSARVVLVTNDSTSPTVSLRIVATGLSGLVTLEFVPSVVRLDLAPGAQARGTCFLKLTSWGSRSPDEDLAEVQFEGDDELSIALADPSSDNSRALIHWGQRDLQRSGSGFRVTHRTRTLLLAPVAYRVTAPAEPLVVVRRYAVARLPDAGGAGALMAIVIRTRASPQPSSDEPNVEKSH